MGKNMSAEYKENMLDGTARLMFNVFNKTSGKYNKDFEKLMLQGGGGNSLFVNCWTKPSESFIKKRISGEAKKQMQKLNFNSIDEVPNEYKHNNAKGAKNRRNKGKIFHLDHSPGNVKVLQLIHDKCKEYDLEKQEYEDIIKDLKEYLKTVQTLDWITVEQDDKRTLKDKNNTKKQKDMMTHEQRDIILNDTWEDL